MNLFRETIKDRDEKIKIETMIITEDYSEIKVEGFKHDDGNML